MKIYLAGPMSGGTYEEAMWWRKVAEARLTPRHILLSPMRGVKPETFESDFLTKGGGSPEEYRRDLWDVSRCDVLLAYLDEAKRVSIGTCFEIAWAAQRPDCLVITVMREGNPHWHLMPREASDFVVPTLDEAFAQIDLAGESR